jgi:carbon storage regulator
VLILTRRVGESIVVGDDIVLTVFEVRGDAVRVGIEAPRSVQVHRQEVYDELKRINEQASSPTDDAVDALRDALGAVVTDPAAPGTDNAEPPVERRELSVVTDDDASAADAEPTGQQRSGQNPATGHPQARRAKPAPPANPRQSGPGKAGPASAGK